MCPSSISASHREGVFALLSAFTTCPGLFYPTPAQDGILSRLRIPGGILNSQQCQFIASIADNYGGGYVDVTNRANIQIREIKQEINLEVLQGLQALGLGAADPNIDHIRNIMTSPTAGIDPQELIDTRPLVKDWDNYITTHPHFSGLSAKFSVCFDGGGNISLSDRPNDITFVAHLINGSIYFLLYLSFGEKGEPPRNTGIFCKPDECISFLAALAEVYLQYINQVSSRKPRLRQIITQIGLESYLQQVQQHFNFSFFVKHDIPQKTKHDNLYHLGIYPQSQPGLFYIGVVLPLGRLESWQIRGLANLVTKYGDSNIRLTPWQNLLITNIPQKHVPEVKKEITALGLTIKTNNIKSALVACSGKQGCAASATDTKSHALALAEYLEKRMILDYPISIHFTGCVKSCAKHDPSDITLVGVSLENENHQLIESYHVYIGEDHSQKFGFQLYQYVTFPQLLKLIENILKTYQIKRLSPKESFKEFANRYLSGFKEISFGDSPAA
ncbi:precorrin-3B synthase [Cronbergia sp. UHCC 0137]|uniref:precorrin-3B synthase n=1 Tax=Cronbergia sp. UHCC 0137 TaxID=3110239 RepID=UPI002B201A49|nr:precorrin-3B synthase [Cronbergia sp. UHCC 0137]MEA5620762.1 precorrin-3B synthase [Cronbergia sp. UHCC 0137]